MQPSGYFRDVTPESGVDFTYRNGAEADHYAILESLGGGVALIDYDGDGLLDVFLTGGGHFGGADKKQMQEMVRLTLRLSAIPRPDDAADAVAIAICDIYTAPMLRRISDAR